MSSPFRFARETIRRPGSFFRRAGFTSAARPRVLPCCTQFRRAQRDESVLTALHEAVRECSHGTEIQARIYPCGAA